MKHLIAVALLLLGLTAVAADAPKPISLTWLGQACFIIKSPGGVTVLADPYGDKIGYQVTPVPADVVTVSHEHMDHNNVAMAVGAKQVLRGLDAKGDWAKIDATQGDVKIRTVGVLHYDADKDKERGKDAVFIFDIDGKTIVHLGDLGRLLTPEQIKAIGRVDVLLVPVGSVYTIDAKMAKQVVDQLNPKIVVPMHYKTDQLSIPLDKVDPFLAMFPADKVKRLDSPTVEITTLPAEMTVMVPKVKE